MDASAQRRRWIKVCGFLATLLFCAAHCPAEPPLTGVANPQLVAFDKLLVSFVGGNSLPGASLAVTRRGKLVYARGCGYSDVAKREELQPDALFRTASNSKPITAVAILQLMEQGKLKLDDPILMYLAEVVPGAKRKTHPWSKVTIRHCLQHTGGWDTSKAKYDPLFRSIQIADALKVPPPASAKHVIRFMATKRPDFPAGDRYAYSNFGYLLLGRIIEQASHQSYEQYVQEHVLRPIGIQTARLGKTRLKDRAPGEVLYYDGDKRGRSVFSSNPGDSAPTPYGVWCLEAMDANGGWVMSAPDLVRFAAALDLSAAKPLLQPETRKLFIHSRPEGPAGFEADGQPKPFFYGFGWRVQVLQNTDRAHYWHEASFDGVSGLVLHRDDEVNWVIMFNSSQLIDGKLPAAAIDAPLHDAANSVKQWPEIDLFPAN